MIVDFEGTINSTTLTCNITNLGNQISTQWGVGSFRGVPGLQLITDDLAPELFLISGDPIPSFPIFTYRNRLTILVMTSDLDEVIVYCGSGTDPQQANFVLRLYRKCNYCLII